MAAATLDEFLGLIGRNRDWYNSLSVKDQKGISGSFEQYRVGVQQNNPYPQENMVSYAQGQARDIDKAIKSAPKDYRPNEATAAAERQTGLDKLRAAGMPQALISKYQLAPPSLLNASADSIIGDWKAGSIGTMYNLNPEQANQTVTVQRQRTMQDLTAGLTPEQSRNLRGVLGGEVQPGRDSTVIDVVTAPVTEKWDNYRVTDLQAKLKAADPFGYGRMHIHDGMYDDATTKAYTFAVQEAARLQMTPEEYLTQAATQAEKDVAARRAATQTPYVAPARALADPEKTKSDINKHFQETTGRKARPGELAAMTKTFRAYEEKTYQGLEELERYKNTAGNITAGQQFDVQLAAEQGKAAPAAAKMPGAPTIQTYDPEAEAAAQGREMAPTEAGGQDLRTAFDGFMQAIRSF